MLLLDQPLWFLLLQDALSSNRQKTLENKQKRSITYLQFLELPGGTPGVTLRDCREREGREGEREVSEMGLGFCFYWGLR